jgi:MoxR-like ATPase
LEEIKVLADRIASNVERVIIGKSSVVRLLLVAILCEGHVLIDDVPGVGKTMMARALAKSLGLSFHRIQFTPDLLPSDILGVNIFNQKTGDFEFKPGPILSQVILADEINRGTPKTQSSLLECMEERQISVDGTTRKLPRPFLVIATQNPIEHYGTFPLPEAQVDRFLLRVHLGYPSSQDEKQIVLEQKLRHPIEEIEAVTSAEELLKIQQKVKEVHVEESVQDYIVHLVEETRKHERLFLGASPRGSLALFKGAQALAAMQGRNYVLPDDVKALAIPVLAHRIIPRGARNWEASEEIMKSILLKVAVPA